MKPTFEKTVDILVKAYLNDTLQHRNCYACAVGNIVADALGYKIVKADVWHVGLKWEGCDTLADYPGFSKGIVNGWGAVFCSDGPIQKHHPDNYRVLSAKKQIDATGYTWRELAKIERAFELGQYEGTSDKMFNGLMAVVDVLAEIHNVDLSVRENAKALFVKI